MFTPKNIYAVRPLWWFWLPIALLLLVAVINPFLDADTKPLMYAENGFLETLQWLVALGAAGVGVACLRYCRKRPWLGLWVLLGTLGCLYIGLEEISYGQHLFQWHTPAYWQNINDQNETNLHNTSSWFDQKPRLILLIGVICGGIFLPLARRFKPALLPQRFETIYPQDAMFVTALMAVLAHAANWAAKINIVTIYGRASEVNEIFMYYFVLLYLVLLLKRLKSDQPRA